MSRDLAHLAFLFLDYALCIELCFMFLTSG